MAMKILFSILAVLASSCAIAQSAGVLPDEPVRMISKSLGVQASEVIITPATFVEVRQVASPAGRLSNGSYADQWTRFSSYAKDGAAIYRFKKTTSPEAEGFMVMRGGKEPIRLITSAVSWDNSVTVNLHGTAVSRTQGDALLSIASK
ncbi:hypothetical protein [Paucibacter soli]|uniref:hypothetical protein n=1 Tax=Paucibacter soli TaxID=3133433 RepID=UPI003095177E